ncbi:MAG TPA: hypothetical protein VIW03_05115 [Anaeromyxobacter sp.]
MEPDTRTDPDRELERSGDEFEERLEKVEGRIDQANAGADEHRDHAESVATAAARGDDEEDEDGDGDSSPAEFDDPDAEEEEEEDD